jgi:hypothetical protein
MRVDDRIQSTAGSIVGVTSLIPKDGRSMLLVHTISLLELAMNNPAAFSLALVLGSLTAIAQGLGQAGGGSTILHPLPASAGCPVGMQAEQGAGGGLQGARIDGRPLDGSSQKGSGSSFTSR